MSVAGPQLQLPEPLIDADSYAVYAAIVPQTWFRSSVAVAPVLLVQETTIELAYDPPLPLNDSEWIAARNNFWHENEHTWTLEPTLLRGSAYRVIPRAEIQADDARLRLKYGTGWHRLPESIEFVAVSAVGFNATKDKALLYVRQRMSGGVYYMEKRDGVWSRAGLPFGMGGWMA
jgi:hypothetical protein